MSTTRSTVCRPRWRQDEAASAAGNGLREQTVGPGQIRVPASRSEQIANYLILFILYECILVLLHCADGSQTYDNEMTIGEVGLNEIRLADKNDKTYIKFNTDDLMKLRHLSRESLTSSSDFSKGSNKQSAYSKTISPYSSTNSLNSMDSATGMNPNHRNYSHNRASLPHPPVAPTRKKRVAPRPPSQNSITENRAVESHRERSNGNGDVFKKPLPTAMPRQTFHASTPNLNGINHNNNGDSKLTIFNNNNNEHTYNNNNNIENTANSKKSEILNGSITDLGQRLPAALPEDTLDESLQPSQQSRTSSESSDLPTPKKRTIVGKYCWMDGYNVQEGTPI